MENTPDVFLNDILNDISDYVLVIDTEYTIKDANKALMKRFGIVNANDRKCHDALYGVKEPCPHCPLPEMLRTGLETRTEHYTDHLGWCDYSCYPLRKDGRIIGGTIITRDISDRMDTVVALNKSESLLTDVFSCIQDSLYIIDPEFNVLHVNPRMEAIFPEHHPIVGKKCYTLVSNTDVCEGCPGAEILRSGTHESRTKIHYYPHEPGEDWRQGISGDWRELIVYPIFDQETGEITSLLNFVRDITQQKLAENAIEHYRAYIEVLADIRKSFYETTEEECIRTLIDSVTKNFKIDFARFVRIEGGELKQSSLHISGNVLPLCEKECSAPAMKKLHGELHPSFLDAIRNNKIMLFRKGEPNFPFEDIPLNEDGVCIRSILVVPFKDENEQQTAIVFFARRNAFFDDTIISYLESSVKELVRIIDDSRRWKSQQQKLEEEKEKAEAAMLIKTQFLANMSHEIRTPMSAILGFTDLALSDYVLPLYELVQKNSFTFGTGSNTARNEYVRKIENAVQSIKTIRNNAEFLLSMINDILDFSKVDLGRMNLEIIQVDLFAVLEEMQHLYSIEGKQKSIAFSIECMNEIPESIFIDPIRFKQVLVNLIGNAMKFTNHGWIQLRITWASDETAPESKGTLLLSLEDTGIGIAPENTLKIFEPFSQGDSSMTRRFGGTGLGLAITGKILELFSGKISLKSTPGVGTCFDLEIPIEIKSQTRYIPRGNLLKSLQDIPRTDPFKISEAAKKQVFKGLRFLLAEDGPDNRRLFNTILVNAGAELTEAENGDIALNIALESLRKEVPFDLILMDMQMPVMDGYEATRKLREVGYEAPIVALTAHAQLEDRRKCLDIGCNDYLTKPILRAELLQCIMKILGR